MQYLKLILVIIAGSIGVWFAVQKLVVSTDHMAETFTVNNYNTAKQTDQTIVLIDNQLDPQTSQAKNQQAELTAQSDEQTTASLEVTELENEGQALPLNAELDIEAAPEVKVIVNKALVFEEDDKPTDETDATAPMQIERADSDADMQSGAESVTQSTQPFKDIQAKPLELDKKLLDPITPREIIKDTVETKKDTVRALDIAYAVPDDSNCVIPGDDYPRVAVYYRPSSFAIKGQSLTNIDKLVTLYKKCGGKLLVFENKLDADESEERLIQQRQDEVKYYLLQRRVPKADMVFPENQ